MTNLKDIYTDAWYKKRLMGRVENSAAIMVPDIIKEFAPRDLIDFGCGACNFANRFSKRGLRPVVAVDGPSHSAKYSAPEVISVVHDLRHPFRLGRRFDMVFCVEVIEHVEPKFEDEVIKTLINHTERYVLLTAAPEGQGGRHHVNCKPTRYWKDKFIGKGFRHKREIVERLKVKWEKSGKVARWYYQNLMVFEK